MGKPKGTSKGGTHSGGKPIKGRPGTQSGTKGVKQK